MTSLASAKITSGSRVLSPRENLHSSYILAANIPRSSQRVIGSCRTSKIKDKVVIIIFTERIGGTCRAAKKAGATVRGKHNGGPVGLGTQHLGADDDTLAAGGLLLVDVLVLG